VGYGYQFWRCRHNAYRGDGAFGQYCIILPEHDAVLTMVSGVQDMQVVLDKVWEHLLPALQKEALPADPQGYSELCAKLTTLALPLASGGAASPHSEKWSAKTYQLENNHLELDSVTIQFGEQTNILTLRNQRGEHPIQVGYSTWLKGSTAMRGCGDEPSAACGAWTTEDTYEVRICCTEDAYCPVFRFHYMGSELQMEVEPNATWDWEPAGVTKIVGRTGSKKD
jgi:hypothetical protein